MSGVLVVHPGAVGDVVLAVPAVRAIRRAAGGETVTVAAQPRIGELLCALGVVDRSVDFEGLGLEGCFVDDGERARLPLVEGAGRVVCWFGAREPVFVRRLREVKPGAVVAPPGGAGELVWQYLRRSVGEPPDGDDEPIDVAPALVEEGLDALREVGWDGVAPLVMVHPGAGGAAKRWPVEGFAAAVDAVARERGLAVVVHCGPADAEAVAMLRPRLPRGAMVLDRPSLSRLAGALGHVTLYLGNDSGVSHLAAAVGAPSVALFTRAHLAWRPWSPAARVVVVSTATLDDGDLARVLGAARETVV